MKTRFRIVAFKSTDGGRNNIAVIEPIEPIGPQQPPNYFLDVWLLPAPERPDLGPQGLLGAEVLLEVRWASDPHPAAAVPAWDPADQEGWKAP